MIKGFIDRFTSFFPYFSEVQECSREIASIELTLIYLMDEYSKAEDTATRVEAAANSSASLLSKAHSLTFHCYYGLEFDLLDKEKYYSLAKDPLRWVRAVLK